jgi:hypothetical protein
LAIRITISLQQIFVFSILPSGSKGMNGSQFDVITGYWGISNIPGMLLHVIN